MDTGTLNRGAPLLTKRPYAFPEPSEFRKWLENISPDGEGQCFAGVAGDSSMCPLAIFLYERGAHTALVAADRYMVITGRGQRREGRLPGWAMNFVLAIDEPRRASPPSGRGPVVHPEVGRAEALKALDTVLKS